MHKIFDEREWFNLCEAWDKAMLLEGVGKLRLGYSYSDVLDVLPDVLDWVGIDTFSVNFSQSKALRIHELWQDKLFSALSDYSDQLEEDWISLHATTFSFQSNGGVFQDCAVIVCAQAGGMSYFEPSNPKYNLKEEQFGEYCDIYHIQPTIEEWAKWAE